jgi:hypothetical protein
LNNYRKDLPLFIPKNIKFLPIQNGYPVPWFASKIGDQFDFRIADSKKLNKAIAQNLCWVCGQKLNKKVTFAIGPMCAINCTSAEPPSHFDCVEWSAKACPFLVQPKAIRRDANIPDGVKNSPAGISIDRNPGIVLLWTTRRYNVVRVSNGILFKLGIPSNVTWLCQGRQATKAECLESIESGYPALLELAKLEGRGAVMELEFLRDRAMRLLPKR